MAELADRLRSPYIRVFGGGGWGDPITTEILDHAATIMDQARAGMKCRGLKVEMILETHDAFSSSHAAMQLVKHAGPLAILWDSHHTYRLAGETLQESWDAMKPLVKHVHVKDSLPEKWKDKPYRLTLPGDGDFPINHLYDILKAGGFSEGVSLEWEWLWNKDLPPLPEALARFVADLKANGLAPGK
jgi:sugar phosphate isomerase/epimerase